MSNNEIVQKLWNLCDVLRDDGINYSDYVTELVLLLFLKMEYEQEQPVFLSPPIPTSKARPTISTNSTKGIAIFRSTRPSEVN